MAFVLAQACVGVPPRPPSMAESHTEPGDVRVGAKSSADGVLASAYLKPDERRPTLVLLNTTERAADIELTPAFDAAKSSVYRTSFRPGRSRRWKELGAVKGALRLPARAVATVVYER